MKKTLKAELFGGPRDGETRYVLAKKIPPKLLLETHVYEAMVVGEGKKIRVAYLYVGRIPQSKKEKRKP